MWLQLLRAGSGGLAALLLGQALEISLDGESHWVLTYVLLYGAGALCVVLCAWCWVLIDRRKRPRRSEPVTAEPAFLKATGTSDAHFPRIESASDSLGHVAKRNIADTLVANTEHVLRPGQQVTFELQASDPHGDDLEVRVVLGMGATPEWLSTAES